MARAIRRLNEKLADRNVILMGPGRWGSRDLRMGVRVGYADINNTRILVEIARRKEGYVPELSYGSHFFQDLVESEIYYLALYPDEPGVRYNSEFLLRSPNRLTEILTDARGLEDVVRVIDVPATTPGLLLDVDMDGESQQALGYLAPAGR